MKNKVLFISVGRPGKGGAESLQVAKFLKHLKNHFFINFLTQHYYRQHRDESFASVLTDINITEIPVYPAIISKIINRVPFHFLYFFSEHFFIVQRFAESAKKKDFDIIYSRSTPFSTAVAAMKIKKKTNKPWVMHLSDPWADNSYLSRLFQNKRAFRYHQKMEERCFENADTITLTSHQTIDFYAKKYPHLSDKLQLIPNSFELSKKPKAVIKTSKTRKNFKLLYTGNLYFGRTPSLLLEVLEKIQNELAYTIEINFLGFIDNEVKADIMRFRDLPVNILGSVNYTKVHSYIEKADFLLSIDKIAGRPSDLCFLPSKLIDYIPMQKPVIVITNKNSASWEIAKENDWLLADISNADDIASLLKNLPAHSSYADIDTDKSIYNIENSSKQLINCLLSLINK